MKMPVLSMCVALSAASDIDPDAVNLLHHKLSRENINRAVDGQGQFSSWIGKLARSPVDTADAFSTLPLADKKSLLHQFRLADPAGLAKKLDAMSQSKRQRLALTMRRTSFSALIQGPMDTWVSTLQQNSGSLESAVSDKDKGATGNKSVETSVKYKGVRPFALPEPVSAEKSAACPWLAGPTSEAYVAMCGDGTTCHLKNEGKNCCNEHDLRAKCPPNYPWMCNEAGSDHGGRTYTCHKKGCWDHGGIRTCDFKDSTTTSGPTETVNSDLVNADLASADATADPAN
jgi:hypothetical protein